MDQYSISIEDKLRTFIEHITDQIINVTKSSHSRSLFLTGGGALNDFLVMQIKSRGIHQVIVPHKTIVEYKEALIFAFLGVLRVLGEVNVMGSVTGAPMDHCSGAIYVP